MSWSSSSEVVVVEGVVSVYWLSALYRRDRLIPAYCTHRNYIYLCMYVYILRIYELSPNEILYVCMYVCMYYVRTHGTDVTGCRVLCLD